MLFSHWLSETQWDTVSEHFYPFLST